MSSLLSSALAWCLVLFFSLPALGQDWVRFRGANGAGLGGPTTLPVQWTDKDYRWKVELPGPGHSSPVVWGDRVFVTCCDVESAKRIVVCLNASDGSVRWKREFSSLGYRQHADNSYAASTPAVDGRRVYLTWTTPDECSLLAIDHDGKDVWKLNLGRYTSQHGSGVSPIVFEGLVILTNDQEGRESFIVAVDCETGQVRWRTPRKSGSMAASTPCIYEPPDQPAQLITTSRMEGIVGYDPLNGQRLWQIADVFQWRVIASPIVAGDLVIGNCGEASSGKALVAVRPKVGNQKAEVAWRMVVQAPYVPTPLAKGGLLFTLSDNGVLSCLRSATGQVIWQQHIGGSYYSSPVCVNDRVYCISKKGEVVVVAAAEQFQLLARNQLGELCYSTPAIAGGRLYIRTLTHLICIGGR